jgi:AcrR family transcriptional regulator
MGVMQARAAQPAEAAAADESSSAGKAPSAAGPPRRADARRNYDAVLAAATEAFAAHGVDASLEEVARQAGVGIGTLYRHFPTRDALVEAVYRREVERLCDGVDELLAERPPAEALATWMQRFVAYVATKRGMATALKAAAGADSELFAYAHRRIRTAIETLLSAAAESGEIREDIDSTDLLRAMSGICLANDQPGWEEQSARLVSLLMDGLRYGAGPAPSR